MTTTTIVKMGEFSPKKEEQKFVRLVEKSDTDGIIHKLNFHVREYSLNGKLIGKGDLNGKIFS